MEGEAEQGAEFEGVGILIIWKQDGPLMREVRLFLLLGQ